jgi:hypothetical protein
MARLVLVAKDHGFHWESGDQILNIAPGTKGVDGTRGRETIEPLDSGVDVDVSAPKVPDYEIAPGHTAGYSASLTAFDGGLLVGAGHPHHDQSSASLWR